MLIVHLNDEDKCKFRESKHCDKDGNFIHGVTAPTQRIVKRRFEEMYKQGRPGMFKPDEVREVEKELHSITQKGENGKLTKDVYEELVEFEEYMVDPEHPNGITVTQDSPLVKQYPEILFRGEQRRKYEEERRQIYEDSKTKQLREALLKSQRRQKKDSGRKSKGLGSNVKGRIPVSKDSASTMNPTNSQNQGTDEDRGDGDEDDNDDAQQDRSGNAWSQLDVEVGDEIDDELESGDDDDDDDEASGGGRASVNNTAYQQLKEEEARLIQDKQGAEQERRNFQRQMEKAVNAHVKKLQQKKVKEKQEAIDQIDAKLAKIQSQMGDL